MDPARTDLPPPPLARPGAEEAVPGSPRAEPGVPPDPVVSAVGLGKRFDIYKNDRSRMLEFLGTRTHHTEHWALRDVSFQVERGRSFGIVGPNGAGKSTLLKLIGGITRPTEGRLEVSASLSTLLDLGLGFHQSFTGRENIRLNCSLLGMREEEVEARIPQIIAFAELRDFIDYPVRTYSSGMNLRLGFAIAAHTDSDIFLVDEVLAVGDQYFQRRCVKKIEEFLEEGRTIILVSHDLHAVRSLCDTALWIDRGRVQAHGPAREVVERYVDVERERAAGTRARQFQPIVEPVLKPTERPATWESTEVDPDLRRHLLDACRVPDAAALWAEATATTPYDVTNGDTPVVQGSGEVRVLSVQLLDSLGRPRERFRTGEDLVVAVTFRTTEPVVDPIFGAAIFRADGIYVHGPNSRYDGVLGGTYHGIYTYFIRWRSLPLLGGRYRISIAVFDRGHLKPHVWHNQLYDLEMVSDAEDHGIALLEHGWGLLTHHEG